MKMKALGNRALGASAVLKIPRMGFFKVCIARNGVRGAALARLGQKKSPFHGDEGEEDVAKVVQVRALT
jgi:hypothetical protein